MFSALISTPLLIQRAPVRPSHTTSVLDSDPDSKSGDVDKEGVT